MMGAKTRTGAAALAVLAGQLALAQTNRMPEIVVTATREPQDALLAPATTYNLDAQAVQQERASRTTPDVFEGLPSVMVQKTSQGQGSPFIRGFTGFRTLMLVDGVRLNNSVFRDGPNQYWSTIDPLSVERFELAMGPSSVLYGSDAIGGTAQAFTLAPPPDDRPGLEKSLYYRGSTAERSHTGRAQVRGRLEEGLGFAAGVSLKAYGDLRGGDEVGTQEHTGYDEQDYDVKADHRVGDKGRLTLAHQTVRQNDAWRAHRTIYAIDWEGLSKGDDLVHTFDQARDLTYARYQAADLPGFVDGVDFTLARHAQGEEVFRVRKDSSSDLQGFDVETWGATLQFSSSGRRAGDWVYGAEFYRDGVDSFSRKYAADGSLTRVESQGPVADNAVYETAGLFAQDTLRFLDGALEVVPGARYTHAAADADRVKDPLSGEVIGIEHDWDAVVGSLRLLHPLTPDRNHVVFTGVGQGFRAPNLSDLSRFDIARSGELETPAPDLDPEHFVSWEAGFKSRGEKLHSRISVYHTWVDDMIIRVPTGREIEGSKEVTKLNSGDGYVQGVEIFERLLLPGAFSAWVSGSWMDTEIESFPTSEAAAETQYLSRTMPLTGQAGVRWQEAGSPLWLEVLGDAADKADHLSPDDGRDTQRIPPGGTPGYAVLTARGGTTLAGRLDVSLALENILDEDYRIHGSGVNEPGRNLVLTAGCTF